MKHVVITFYLEVLICNVYLVVMVLVCMQMIM
jgi:hypothetical protein